MVNRENVLTDVDRWQLNWAVIFGFNLLFNYSQDAQGEYG